MKSIFKKLGINYDIMKLIVKNKFIMDKRRGQGDKEKNYLMGSLIVYLIVGLFIVPIIGMDFNPMIKMSIFFSIFMIMILNVFITDFSSVILDINDKEILLTKGVDNKTLNASKLIHIITYIGILSLAICGGTIIFSIRYGVMFTLTLVANIFLIDIFMLIITAIFYSIILKVFSGEKLKDMINMFQIIFFIVFVIGFQFVSRAFSFSDLEFIYQPELWNLLVPPMWFAANFNILLGVEVDNIIKILSFISIIIPIISLIIYARMIPTFENNLQKLNDNTTKTKKSEMKLYQKVGKVICANKEERVFFNFVYEILNKDRDFKTKVYPSLAMGIFMPFLMMISFYEKQGILTYLNSLQNTNNYFNAYLCVMLTQNAITLIRYSKEYEGAWIYNIIPIKNDNNIYLGMFKATIYKLNLPVFIILGILFIPIFKVKVIVDIIIVFLVSIIVSMYVFKMDSKDLPFSIEAKQINSASGIVTMIKSLFIIGVFALMHYFVRSSIVFKVLYIVCLLVFMRFSMNKIFK